MPIPGFRPAPGPQQPQKYPIAPGPNYRRLGEQPGFIYNPYQDRYIADPKAQQKFAEEQGLAPKTQEPPSLAETLLPVAGVGLAIEAGKGLGQTGVSKLGGLVGLGGQEALPGGIDIAANTAGQTVAGQAAGGAALPSVTGSTLSTGASAAPLPVIPGAEAAANPGLFSGIAGAPAYVPALVAGATYLGGKSAYNMLQGKDDNSIQGKVGRGLLGVATGGLSEIAKPFLSHESTRDYTAKNTKGLLDVGKDDAAYQSYVTGMRDQYKTAPTDPSKAFAGKYATFDEYQKAGLEANNLTGVYGNIKAYGPRWAQLSEEQRQAVTQENINSGLYYSKKGDVLINDEAKALENLNKIAPENPQVKGAAPTGPSALNGPVVKIDRSKTRSPGIDKNGNRIPSGLLGVR